MKNHLGHLGTGLWLATLLCCSTGCTTYYGDARARQMASEQEDANILQNELRRLNGRIEDLEMQGDGLRDDMDFAKRDQSRFTEDQVGGLRRDIEDMQRRLSELEAARKRDKAEILDSVAQTVSKLVRSSGGGNSSPVSRSPRRSSSEYGYEHTVEPGQTLSAIAKAYNVSSKNIIDANDLTNPDQLRVGQVLFIPE